MGERRPDLFGIDNAIRLKTGLLEKLRTTRPASWPDHVAQFVSALGESDLHDASALLVFLTALKAELLMLAGVPKACACLAVTGDAEAWGDDCRSGLLRQFEREVLDALQMPAVLPNVRSAAVRDAIQFIDDHYSEPLTLQSVATAVGRSPRHLGALFRRELGVTVRGYVTAARIRRATTLIRDGQAIASVSRLVGYKGKTNFYRHFKAHIGLTPLAYRAAWVNVIPAEQPAPGR